MTNQKKLRLQAAYARNKTSKKQLIPERLKYIRILLDEFEFRRSTSPFYSLRDFSRDLNLDPGHLSRVLKNQKGLSRRKAEYISLRLNLPFNDRKIFLRLVSASCARSLLSRNLAKLGLKNQKLGRILI